MALHALLAAHPEFAKPATQFAIASQLAAQ
jgi:hypothetical protein